MALRARSTALAAVPLALLLAGCAGWHQVEVSTSVLDRPPGEIRVTLPDGQRVVLDHPQLVHDSILGTIHGQDTSVALSDVQRMALRRPDREEVKAAGTVWLAALLTVVAAWVVLLVSSS